MIVNAFETPPTVYAGQFLAAPDINLLARNCVYLDQMSYRRETVFDSLSRLGHPSSAWHSPTTFLLWRGGLLYRAHYQTLTVKYRRVGALPGTARLRIFVNGVQRSEFVPAAGDGVQTVALSGQNYTPESPLTIEIRTHGLSTTDRTSEWWVTNVYATPAYVAPTLSDPTIPTIGGVTPATSAAGARPWLPLPSFAGVYGNEALNIIGNNQLHLYDRMNQVPLVPNRSYMQAIMSHNIGDWEIWTGRASKITSSDTYRLGGSLTLLTAGSDTIRVYMDDVLQTTLGPYTTVGTHTIDLQLPFPAGVPPRPTRIKLVYNSTVYRLPHESSRLSITTHRTDPSGAGYPALNPPAVVASASNYSATSVNTTLNAIVAMLSAIKTRVDSSGNFGGVRATRDNFGYDDHGRRSLDRVNPMQFQRRGSRLVVYGKNVQMGFGGQVFELDEDNHNTYKYKFANEMNIISGDKYDLKTIYLDSIKGLYPGDLYFLIGDATFAAEYHK